MGPANAFFDGRKRYFQTDFYVAQRKQRRLLLEPDGQPTGGEWSFDADNRAKFPPHETVPAPGGAELWAGCTTGLFRVSARRAGLRLHLRCEPARVVSSSGYSLAQKAKDGIFG